MARTRIHPRFHLWAAAGCLVAASTALAAPFALIPDLNGEAWAMEGAQPRKLSLLGYIENTTEIKVEPAAKLAITYFANGVQYNFAGPARVSLESAAPKVIDGQAAESKKVTPEKSIEGGLSADQWRRLQQATVVMRTVKSSFAVVGPDKTEVLAREPEFEWTPVPGAKGYRLVVYGPGNEILHEATSEQTSARPGAALGLQPGKRYRWKVDALGVAKPVTATGIFSVADEATRERLSSLKSSAGNELAARTFYATTLEAQGHGHDARGEWKALMRDFPDEPAIVQRSR
jgi:hypothetical protein